MIENLVESTEIKEWLEAAENPRDVIAVLEEYKGRDVFLSGWNFAIRIQPTNLEKDPLEIMLEAYCPDHPNIKHNQEFFVRDGESLYKCFLDMIKPFRKLHPYHSLE